MKLKVSLLDKTLVLENREWGNQGYTTNYLLVLSNVVNVNKGKHSFDKIVLHILEELYFIDSTVIANALDNDIEIIEITPTAKYNEYLKKYPDWSNYSSYLANTRNKVHTELNFPYSTETSDGSKGWDIKHYKINEKHPKDCIVSKLLRFIKSEHHAEDWFINHSIKSKQFVVINKDNLCLKEVGVSYETKDEAEKNVCDKSRIVYLP